MGNYSRPLKISTFVKELSTAFSILNLKNDNLRKRFDSIKYDVKKIEEGMSLFSHSLCRSVVLSLSLCLSSPSPCLRYYENESDGSCVWFKFEGVSSKGMICRRRRGVLSWGHSPQTGMRLLLQWNMRWRRKKEFSDTGSVRHGRILR